MTKIPLYSQEISDGLSEIIQKNNRVSLAALAEIDDSPRQFSDSFKELLRGFGTELDQIDLFSMKSLMVSTGMNKNIDFFLKEELFKAQATPQNKPVNLEHQPTKILGHIIGCTTLDDEGKDLSAIAALDEMPDSFNIFTNSVLYKISEDETWQKEIDKAIAGVEAGKKYVSMECLFSDFDYVLLPAKANWDDSSQYEFVSRNKETSFLTKYVKAFGGVGVYKDKKVGRVFRDFIFSAMGLVDKPANPKSVTYTAKSKCLTGAVACFLPNLTAVGYLSPDGESETVMSNEVDTKVVAELQAKLEKAEATLREQSSKEFEKKIVELETKLAKATEVSTEVEKVKVNLETELKAKADEIVKLTEKLTETEKVLGESTKALEEIAEEKAFASRLETIVDALGVDKADEKALGQAKELTTNLKVLKDEQFAAHAAILKATKPTGTGAAPAPFAQTPKTVGGPKIPVTGSTTGAIEQAKAALAGVAETGEAALAVTGEVPNTEDLRKNIAEFLKKPAKNKPVKK